MTSSANGRSMSHATGPLERALRESASRHTHLCPRQVLGARIGLLAGRELGLRLPRRDRRMIAIVETDGCFVDGLAIAAGCSVGERTLRLEDYGKVAASFVDTETGRALRITPHSQAREFASRFAPAAENRWQAQLIGYQVMPDDLLLSSCPVRLVAPLAELVGEAHAKARCEACGEEVIDLREVVSADRTLCRACAFGAYYLPGMPPTARRRRQPKAEGVGTTRRALVVDSR